MAPERREARLKSKAAALVGQARSEALWDLVVAEAAPDELGAALT